jgi:BirA family transcriptional regulator, biotin operon repressor / biotin---[acetyl-CoA-carboxylase] ligase
MSFTVPGRTVYWHPTLDTTMTEASRLAREGAAAGTIVGAEQQTAGQGRHGHSWHSPQAEGLYFTVILRPGLPPQQVPLITLALGCAVHDALHILTGIYADLRWPNDVLINGKKVCGILAHLEGDCVLAGIGLNVNQSAFPPELAAIATSLLIETGRQQEREPLLRFLAASIDTQINILTRAGAKSLIHHFAARSSYVERKRVEVDGVRGFTAGLTPDGFLRLHTDAGEVVTIHAGGVRPLED